MYVAEFHINSVIFVCRLVDMLLQIIKFSNLFTLGTISGEALGAAGGHVYVECSRVGYIIALYKTRELINVTIVPEKSCCMRVFLV